jgi:hypothetical protein
MEMRLSIRTTWGKVAESSDIVKLNLRAPAADKRISHAEPSQVRPAMLEEESNV